MNTTWLITGIGCLLGSIVFLVVMALQKHAVFNKPFWLCTGGALAGFALAALLTSLLDSFTMAFWVLEGLALLLGVAGVLLVHRLFPWASAGAGPAGLLYHVALALGGGAAIVAVYRFYVGADPSGWPVALGALPFLVPGLLYQSYVAWRSIPARQYKRWRPAGTRAPVFDMQNPIEIDFNISSVPNQEPTIVLRMHAPRQKSVGSVFHFLIDDYNAENQHNPIALYANPAENRFAGWVFQVEYPNRKPRVVEAEKSFEANRIPAGAVVTARSFKD
jgi:hypothetical protein